MGFDNIVDTVVDFINSGAGLLGLFWIIGNSVQTSEIDELVLDRRKSWVSSKHMRYIDNIKNSVYDEIAAIYHSSVPVFKMNYPQTFQIASSFMHNDLWYAYIVTYNYWVWALFSPVIIFFSMKGLELFRRCRIYIRPMRETRGVSRSKCADLITSIIPVLWAISIIINESADAIDFFDGFGTAELVIGIRAYQWGWEYYYPKDLDLFNRLKSNNSLFLGKSVKYNNMEPTSIKVKRFWKFYQMKLRGSSLIPAHLLILPSNDSFFNNFLRFKDIGNSVKFKSASFSGIKMFSKFYTYNLYSLNPFNLKTNNVFTYLNNDINLYNFFIYSLKRQSSFLGNNNTLNNGTSFLDTKSLKIFSNNNSYNNELSSYNGLNLISILRSDTAPLAPLYNLFNYTDLDWLLNLKNNKDIDNLVVNNIFTKKNLTNPSITFLNNNHPTLFNKYNIDLGKNTSLLKNVQIINKTGSEGSNFSFINDEKFLKNFSKRDVYSASPVFKGLHTSKNPNPAIDFGENSLVFNMDSLKLNSKFGGFSFKFLLNLLSSNLYLDQNFSPLSSNFSKQNPSNFDYFHSFDPLTEDAEDELKKPIFLTRDNNPDRGYPQVLIDSYWTLLFETNLVSLRFDNANMIFNNRLNTYMPTFPKYHEYSSKNFQLLNFLEDLVWDNNISVPLFSDYLDFIESIESELCYDKKTDIRYYVWDLLLSSEKIDKTDEEGGFFQPYEDPKNPFEPDLLENDQKPVSIVTDMILKTKYIERELYKFLNDEQWIIADDMSSDVIDNTNPYANILAFEDTFLNLKLTPRRFYFFYFLWSQNSNYIDESYDFYKNFNTTSLLFNKNFFLLNNYSINPKTYSYYIDNFRVFSDAMFWLNSDLFLSNNKISGVDMLQDSQFFLKKDLGLSEYLNRRSTSRESYVYYNSFQLVFKSRLDEGRSNSKLLLFSQTFDKNPYLTSKSIKYNTILSKNKNSYTSSTFYRDDFIKNFNNFYFLDSSLNFYFYDFPFLISEINDTSRYLWFDWYARWVYVDVKPSNQSKYDLYGAPRFTKMLEMNKPSSDYVTDTESYFSKLTKARENYFQNWSLSPYTTYKNLYWFEDFLSMEGSDDGLDNFEFTRHSLNELCSFYTNFIKTPNNNYQFINSRSNIFNKGRSFWRPFNGVESYVYNITILVDIMNKREYLFREYLFNKFGVINVPNSYITTPSHPLIAEFKSSFNFLNTNKLNSEFSKDIYFNYLNLFDNFLNKNLNISLNNDLLFNDYSTKSQYKPMRKGITNMIRLHATGSIALPTETRIQVLASSKDVIHSWAVPSAGVKIDCVPGYSSHRIMVFLLTGIFWGQCMEICGRYHHWMPIIVFFMKKDLFFLWAYHFVFLSNKNLDLSMCNDMDVSLGSKVSFNKSGWLGATNSESNLLNS